MVALNVFFAKNDVKKMIPMRPATYLFIFLLGTGLLAAGYLIRMFHEQITAYKTCASATTVCSRSFGAANNTPCSRLLLQCAERLILSKPSIYWAHRSPSGGYFTSSCEISGLIGARHKEPENITPASCSNAWSNLEEYLSRRPAPAPVEEIKSRFVNLLADGSVKGQYGLYFEDLNSGARFGINETNLYNQWSLLKVMVAATILKKAECREVNLESRIKLDPAGLNTATLYPELNHAGDELTVRELLDRLIRYSDNTASFALSSLFRADEFQDTLLAVGTLPAPSDKPRNFLPSISPKEYANALRDLYFAKYLSKPSSELILALMANTVYDSQIRMGLPPDIRVAHKVGFDAGCGEFHDCGIVYRPGAPYILCIMSKNSTREESDRVISELSRLVYGFMREKRK